MAAAGTTTYVAADPPFTARGVSEPVNRLFRFFVFCWVLGGAIVLFEPSPYEIFFLAVLPLSFFTGLTLHRRVLNMFNFLLLFLPFAAIAAFQVKFITVPDALLYSGITVFLWFAGYFAANFVANDPLPNTRLIMRAYTLAAVGSALVGTLGYLDLIPGADLFVRYDRAKAAFEDPNVFGPFIIPPAIFALQSVFTRRGFASLVAAGVYAILFIGVFVSFSRAAWGYMALSSVLVFFLCYIRASDGRQQARMLLLAVAGAVSMIAVLGALLSITTVQELFDQRASLSQSYDTGETGRFGRQSYALELALENPLGMGPLEFRNYRVGEEPHNTYVNVVLAYGWGGGLAYWALIGVTLWRLFVALGDRSDRQVLILPLFASYVPLALEGAIIDTDHWRHFFLLTGIVWGVTAARGPVSLPTHFQYKSSEPSLER